MATSRCHLGFYNLPTSWVVAKNYYRGLYSEPTLVARTGSDLWNPPVGAGTWLPRKELRTVGNHPLAALWQDNLALQFHDILESKGVKWTSTDVVRIGVNEEPLAPVILWIGITPATLPGEEALAVANECKRLLVMNQIIDVEVEIRESVVTRYVGPKLRGPSWVLSATADLVDPMTSTLGLFISNATTPWAEGTGGFYVTDNNSKLYLVTARHVVFNSDPCDNNTYEHKFSLEPPIKISLFGAVAFTNFIEKIKGTIVAKEVGIEVLERQVKKAVEGYHGMDAEKAARTREDIEKQMEEAKHSIVVLEELYDDVQKNWANLDNRILGHIRFSPSLQYGCGPNRYTQDYALIEIDSSKIDAASFEGNAIHLGSPIEHYKFFWLMFPNPEDRRSQEYPIDGLLHFECLIPDAEMFQSASGDLNGDPCLTVIKCGNGTGLTIGRANNVPSYVRNYSENGKATTSMEWAIINYDGRNAPFSQKGDSGSGIVDCRGRLGGLLTGGAGTPDWCDITYATPISFIMDSLKANGYKVSLNVKKI